MPNFPSIYLELQELWKRLLGIADNIKTVQDDIADGMPPSGPAGGILYGTYPNPTGLKADTNGMMVIQTADEDTLAGFITDGVSHFYIKTQDKEDGLAMTADISIQTGNAALGSSGDISIRTGASAVVGGAGNILLEAKKDGIIDIEANKIITKGGHDKYSSGVVLHSASADALTGSSIEIFSGFGKDFLPDYSISRGGDILISASSGSSVGGKIELTSGQGGEFSGDIDIVAAGGEGIGGSILIKSGNGAPYGIIRLLSYSDISLTGSVKILNHIQFSGGGQSQFNKYDEGVWTPTTGSGITGVSTTSGYYTIIGNMCFLQGVLGTTTAITSSGNNAATILDFASEIAVPSAATVVMFVEEEDSTSNLQSIPNGYLRRNIFSGHKIFCPQFSSSNNIYFSANYMI